LTRTGLLMEAATVREPVPFASATL